MSIANLPTVLTATDNKGGVVEFVIAGTDDAKIGIMWIKMQELIYHINDLEEKLLSAEERMEAEDLKEANAALKRDKFIEFKTESEGGLDSGININ